MLKILWLTVKHIFMLFSGEIALGRVLEPVRRGTHSRKKNSAVSAPCAHQQDVAAAHAQRFTE
jgi:hypothetical protein